MVESTKQLKQHWRSATSGRWWGTYSNHLFKQSSPESATVECHCEDPNGIHLPCSPWRPRCPPFFWWSVGDVMFVFLLSLLLWSRSMLKVKGRGCCCCCCCCCIECHEFVWKGGFPWFVWRKMLPKKQRKDFCKGTKVWYRGESSLEPIWEHNYITNFTVFGRCSSHLLFWGCQTTPMTNDDNLLMTKSKSHHQETKESNSIPDNPRQIPKASHLSRR